MNPAVEISLCVLAWCIALNRGRVALLNWPWRDDLTAFLVGSASLFFALTMTFLVTPLSDAINRLVLPNFSRLLAYSSVTLTLFLAASSSLITFPVPESLRRHRHLKSYLLATLSLLLVSYFLFVARTPEWEEQPIPATAAEMVFKLVMFSHAVVLCGVIAEACYHYYKQEKVVVTRYRIVMIGLTTICGAAFFFTKSILALAYVWHPLGAGWIHELSKLLMVIAALLWRSSFIHSKIYARALTYLRGIRNWSAFRDLVFLVDQLEHLCPPVGMEMSRPNFWQFMRNSDYHLYRATVHILDGKTLISDFLDDTLPVNKLRVRWDQDSYLAATRLNTLLRGDRWG